MKDFDYFTTSPYINKSYSIVALKFPIKAHFIADVNTK